MGPLGFGEIVVLLMTVGFFALVIAACIKILLPKKN